MESKRDETHVGELYDWWSRHPRSLGMLYQLAFLGREEMVRRQAIATLDLTPGEHCLDVGCGTGNSFAAIRSELGSSGALTGLDVSRGMVRSARNRMRDNHWQNVNVVWGDAHQPPLRAGTFDVAYASMALSAVSEPRQAITAIETLLRPGGRLVVLDAQPFQRWPWNLLNHIIVPVSEYATNWRPQVDLVAVLRDEFETVEVSTFNAGSIFIACARTPARE